MRLLALLLLLLGALLEIFSYWGLHSVAGRAAFDEMAGMIPFAAAPLGFLLLVAAAVLWWRANRRNAAAEGLR